MNQTQHQRSNINHNTQTSTGSITRDCKRAAAMIYDPSAEHKVTSHMH